MSLLKTLLKPFNFILDLFLPDIPANTQQAGTEVTKDATDAFIPVVFGNLGRVKGIVSFQNVGGDDTGDDIENDLLHQIIVISEGPIQHFGDVWLDKENENAERFKAESGGSWYWSGPFSNGLNGWRYAQLEEAGYNYQTHKYTKLAGLVSRAEWDGEGKAFNGKPDIAIDVIRGYGVRHPETNEPSFGQYDNPVFVLHELLINPIFGRGFTDAEFDRHSLIDAWPRCTETVPKWLDSTEQRKRHTCNWSMDTGTNWASNVDTVLSIIRGHLPKINGKYTLIMEQDDDPVNYTLNHGENFWDYQLDEPGSDRFNQVIGEFIDEDNNWEKQEVFFPETNSPLHQTWLAEDNNVINDNRIPLTGTTNRSEAYQRVRQHAYISRESLRLKINDAQPRSGIEIHCGLLVRVEIEELGWTPRIFRCVEKTTSGSSPTVSYEFIEHQPDLYNLEFLPEPTIVPDLPNNLVTVDWPTNLQVTPLYNGLAQVEVSWESTNTRFEWRLKRADDKPIQTGSTRTNSVTLNGLAVGDYVFEVRATTNLGIQKSAFVNVAVPIELPATPTENPTVTVRPGVIDITPPRNNNPLATYEWLWTNNDALNPNEDAHTLFNAGNDGPTLTIPSPEHGVVYYVWYRLVNAEGNGAWLLQTLTAQGLRAPQLAEDFAQSVIDSIPGIDTSDIEAEIEDLITEQIPNVLDRANNKIEQAKLRAEDASLNVRTNTLENQVSDSEQGLYASFTRLNQAFTTLSGHTGAIDALQLQANSEINRLDAALDQISSVEITADNTGTALDALTGQVQDPTNGLSATFTRLQQAEVVQGQQASSITTLQNNVQNLDQATVANAQLAQSAQFTANGAANAAFTAQTSANTADSNANSALTLASDINIELDQIRAVAVITVQANGNAALIQLGATPSQSGIKFDAQNYNFVDANGDPLFVIDSNTGRAVYAGDLYVQNLLGDVTDGAIDDIAAETLVIPGAPGIKLATITIPSGPSDRIIQIAPFCIEASGTNIEAWIEYEPSSTTMDIVDTGPMQDGDVQVPGMSFLQSAGFNGVYSLYVRKINTAGTAYARRFLTKFTLTALSVSSTVSINAEH